MDSSSKKAILAALIGNSLISVIKFVAAGWTGSAAMFSEGIHSLVDTGNQGLLLYGLQRSKRAATKEFPFGFGKEVYFWSFVVAMLIFLLGGVLSIYQGWVSLGADIPIQDMHINYLVIVSALIFEGLALKVAIKEFNLSRGEKPIIDSILSGKDPSIFVVVLEDCAAILGLVIAMLGLFICQLTGDQVWDGIAAISIGLVLLLTSVLLAVESKKLLIGESAEQELEDQIRDIILGHEKIGHVNEIVTLHMGPEFIVAAISVDFSSQFNSDGIEKIVAKITTQIKKADSRVRRVFVEAESFSDHAKEIDT